MPGRFNTQPPEGGWRRCRHRRVCVTGFNTQPPEGGWPAEAVNYPIAISFNTQPPEGGWPQLGTLPIIQEVSTHSRPKAAGDLSPFK